MTTKNFAGSLMDLSVTPNEPVPAGAPITIQITNPDGSAGPTLVATTIADGSYTVQQDLPDGTGYKAVAAFAGRTVSGVDYAASMSPVVTFDVAPTPPPPPPAHQTGLTLTVS